MKLLLIFGGCVIYLMIGVVVCAFMQRLICMKLDHRRDVDFECLTGATCYALGFLSGLLWPVGIWFPIVLMYLSKWIVAIFDGLITFGQSIVPKKGSR